MSQKHLPTTQIRGRIICQAAKNDQCHRNVMMGSSNWNWTEKWCKSNCFQEPDRRVCEHVTDGRIEELAAFENVFVQATQMWEFLVLSQNRCWKKGVILFGPIRYVTVEMAEIDLKLSQINCSSYFFWLCILFLQYRAPYMPPTQQYPVTSGTAGFYPGTPPAEYPAYGKGFCPRPTTTKHNHKHGGLSVKRGEISNTRSPNFKFYFKLKHVVLVHIHLCTSLPTRYCRVCRGFAWLVGVFNVFLGQNTAVCGELPVACGLAWFCFGLCSFYLQSHLTLPYRFHEMALRQEFCSFAGFMSIENVMLEWDLMLEFLDIWRIWILMSVQNYPGQRLQNGSKHFMVTTTALLNIFLNATPNTLLTRVTAAHAHLLKDKYCSTDFLAKTKISNGIDSYTPMSAKMVNRTFKKEKYDFYVKICKKTVDIRIRCSQEHKVRIW